MSGALKGRSILITGGGRGLGAAIAEAVARAGALALIADVNEELARSVAQRLGGEGLRAEGVRLDVTNAEEIQQVLGSLHEKHGRLDTVVNNAGVDVTLPVDELSVEDWERVIAVNLHGPFLMSKFALPYLRLSGQGHILNIASTAARRAWPNASAYHASKWGLLGLSHALHAELRSQGIRVTALLAGGMRTPFLLDRFPDIDVNNLQDPANVAETVVFALSAPPGTVISELMVLPMRETSWP